MLWQYDMKLSQSQASNFLPLESPPNQDPAALDPDSPAAQPHPTSVQACQQSALHLKRGGVT